MYTKSYGEKFNIYVSEYNLQTTDTKAYGEVTRIVNPFDLNITFNNPYCDEEKNKCAFLEIKTEYEKILVVFKTMENPWLDYYYEDYYDYITDSYPDLFKEGVLNFDLINDDNQLVLMYGTSIIILDIDTFEVIKYTTSNSIVNFGIKLSYENNVYKVLDDKNNITCFDKDLNEIK